ncbi:WD repeat-containing protein 6 isoform X2 [Schistocerca nitens]|nr:WD repeat-containing protein 6 isoform X2 [Schistocerca nitens]XP_049805331.1 WD repeat-containing protein 6 isoform X2 [Schistocerca nitens]XP_049805332.1 WD repeat-containing protein 6 isoform X2 [Schistocerca nitens]
MSEPCITFESLYINTDVTCVKCYGDYILTGSGPWFSIYNAETSECLLKCSVFHGQRIHGIAPQSDERIAIFGGRQVVFLHLNLNFKEILNKIRCHVDEWIIELHWLECGRKFAILTADNVISLWKMNEPEQLVKVSCELNCLVYSAVMLKESWSNLIVLAGTAFGKILVWKPALNLSEKQEHVLHTLTGHDGVVSSVSYDAETSVICTTSDDRSVKIWKVSLNHEEYWETASIQLVCSLYGHTARVWKAVIVNRTVVSVGEDSSVMVWGFEGKLLKQWKYHQSSTIWAMDYSTEKKIVVVGGSDGGVIAWPFNMWREESLNHAQLSFHGCLNNSVNHVNHIDGIILRRIVILKDNHVVALTKNAALWHYDDCHGAECKFTFDCKRFSNICLLDISPSRALLAIASCDGEILVMSDENCCRGETLTKLVEVHSSEGAISSLHWASDDCLLVCSSSGPMELWKLKAVGDECQSLTCLQKFSLPTKKRSSVMTAVIHDSHLLFGDRTGNIHVYGLITTDDNNGTVMLDKLHTKHQHGKESVTFIMSLKSEIISVGRDGLLCWFTVANKTLHEVSVCRLPMEWPARILIANGGILIAGFVDVKFIVWSHEEKRILLEVQCGGGHRAWDCAVNEDIFTFLYLKDNVVHRCICSLVDLTRPHLQKGFHLKDINCQKLICENTVKIPYRLVACGSENNTVYLIFLQAGMAPTVAAVLDTHISSVRTLDVCCLRKSEESDLFLLVTAGGRAQLKVWKICVSHSGDEAVLPQVYCSEVCSDILNKCGGKKKAPWKSLQPVAEADMRYMDICILQTEHTPRDTCEYTVPFAFILAGCSDGNWRLLNYNTQCDHLNHLKAFPSQTCVLKVGYLFTRSHYFVFTMDTNGCLRLWDLTADIHDAVISKFQMPNNHKNSFVQTEKQRKPLFSMKVHQTGINSSDTFSVSCERFVIGTGGDDNALSLTMLDLKVGNAGDMDVVCVSQWKDTTAHLAQITGIKMFNGFIITGSVDQCIALWSWSYLSCKLNATKLQSFCSTITDIKGFLAWRTENGFTISLYGQGMELIKAIVNDDPDKEAAQKV